MSERHPNGYFALALVCALCLSSMAYVSITFSFSKGYQTADQEHSTYYAQRDAAEISYRECLDAATDLNGARECINNASKASREAERAEQDLNAQREMAQWAEGMLWAAWIVGLFTVGATIVGVRYVYLTLVATQNMARETTRIGEAQVRAYLTVDEATIEPEIIEGKDTIIWHITAKVRNSGQSPARRPSMLVNGKDFIGTFEDRTGDIASGQVVQMGARIKSDPEKIRWLDDTSAAVEVQISLIYFDVFRPESDPLLDVWMYWGYPEMINDLKSKLFPLGTIPSKAEQTS